MRPASAPVTVRAAPSPDPPAIDWMLLDGLPVTDLDAGLVSCLTVTRGRAVHLARAVRSFGAQTYPHRELVVVYETLEDEARALLEGLGDAVVLVHVPLRPKRPLGYLRNEAVRASRGAYVCCWDDDDWSAPSRIELQLLALREEGTEACMLNRWTLLDETTGRAYVSGKRGWEGSLLCRRELVLALGYPHRERSEDTVLVQRLTAVREVTYLEKPEIYVYTFHGGNTWGADHFGEIFRGGTELSPADAARVREALRGGVVGPGH